MHLPTLGINCLENSTLKITVVETKGHIFPLYSSVWKLFHITFYQGNKNIK